MQKLPIPLAPHKRVPMARLTTYSCGVLKCSGCKIFLPDFADSFPKIERSTVLIYCPNKKQQKL